MRFLILSALAIIATFALIACKSADSPNRVASRSTPTAQERPKSTPHAAPADGVRRITTVELQDLIRKGQAYVIDVRNEASYNAGHVRGARLIPNTEIAQHTKELPHDKTIVMYCS